MRGGNAGQSTTTTIKPADTDQSGWVLFLGGGLILVNFVFGSGSFVGQYLTGNSNAAPPNVPWNEYILMALALLILLGIAKTGESGSNFAVIFLVAVWVVYLLNNQGPVQKIFGQSKASKPTGSSKK